MIKVCIHLALGTHRESFEIEVSDDAFDGMTEKEIRDDLQMMADVEAANRGLCISAELVKDGETP